MSTKLISDTFKLHSALQFVESFTEPKGNLYYMYIGRHRPFVDDNNPPAVATSKYDFEYDTWDNMIHGKRISTSNISLMVRKIIWETGVVYDAYAHDDPLIASKKYFVASFESGSYHIFKCLSNNKDIPSSNQPLFSDTSPTAESYYTADGYQWKYLYTINLAQWNDFTTDSFMPVIRNSVVEGIAQPGAIDTIRLDNPGKNYRSHASAKFSVISVSNDDLIYEITDIVGTDAPLSIENDFYKDSAVYIETAGTKQLRTIADYIVTGLGVKRITISSAFDPLPDVGDTLYITPNVTVTGDGTGVQARAIVNPLTDKIDRIEVISRGKNYTYGSVLIIGNTGLIADPLANTATGTAILGPIDGHGSNNYNELGSYHVCLKTSFSASEGGNISQTNDFREVGVLRDPLIHNMKLNITHRDVGANLVSVGDIVYGQTSNAYGTVTLVPNGNSVQTITVDRVFGIFHSSERIYNGTDKNAAQSAAESDSLGLVMLATIAPAGVDHKVVSASVFDQRWVYNVAKDSGDDLTQDEQIWQDQNLATEASAFVHELAGPLLYLTNKKGFIIESDAGTGSNRFIYGEAEGNRPKYKIIDSAEPDMIYGSGDVLYKENISPIIRSVGQKQDIKLVITF